MTRMLPFRGCFAGRHAYAPRADERSLPPGAFNLIRITWVGLHKW